MTDTVPITTLFESDVLTADEIATMNRNYEAMGLPVRVIDVSAFCAKHEMQADGTYKRTAIRRRRRSNGDADDGDDAAD